MGPDADHQPVLALPADRPGEVEPARGKAAQVLADLLSVEPHGRAELRLVDHQHGGIPLGRRVEGRWYQK